MAADKMAARGEDREAPEAPSPPPPGPGGGVNVFANDGSFLELFKRKMEAEEQQQRQRQAAAAAEAAGGTGGGAGAGLGSQRGADGAKRSGGALSFVRAASLSRRTREGRIRTGAASPVPPLCPLPVSLVLGFFFNYFYLSFFFPVLSRF